MGFFKNVNANYILIPMDVDYQKNHLKAYGLTYWTLEKGIKVKWLLNYRGGSFLLPIILKFIPSLLPSSFIDNKTDE